MTRPFELYYAPPFTVEIKYGMTVPTRDNKSSRPQMLDYFRVTTRERSGNNLKSHDAMSKVLGKEPRAIRIRLLSDNPEENFALFRSWNNKGALLCGSMYGDKSAKRFVSTDGAVKPLEVPVSNHPCNSECTQWTKDLCKLSGNLYFRLDPEYGVDSNALGVLRVKSIHALRLITASLNILKKDTQDILANVPLQLQIHQEIKKDKTGQNRNIPMISIAPGLPIDDFKVAVRDEILRRAELFEIKNGRKHTAFEELEIKDVLSDVQEDPDTELEENLDDEIVEQSPEPKKITIPSNIKKLIQENKMTSHQYNSYIVQYVDSNTAEVDWVGFESFLLQRLGR
jgi:hypothetical protein